MTPGWVDRAAAAETELVTTVRSRSGGSSWTTAWVVEPESSSTVPPVGSSSSTRAAIRRLTSARRPERAARVGSSSRRSTGIAPPCTRRSGAAALEGGEVAAHGLGGDTEGVGEEGDLDPAGAAGLRHDPLLPLRCVHRDSFVQTGGPSSGRCVHQTTGSGSM